MSQRLTSFILKETNSQRKLMTKMMMTGVTVAPAMKVKTVLMMTKVNIQTCCTKQKMEQNIRKEKYQK